MSREAQLELREHGRVPAGSGWFVLGAGDAVWVDGPFGAYTPFENGEHRFAEIGVNVAVLQPGQPNSYYHAEAGQEDFLVLDGECLLIVEGEERSLRRWDFVHCPAWTEHVFVGAGPRPCVLLGIGSRAGAGASVVYPVSELARSHDAGVAEKTDDPAVAYAACDPDLPVEFQPDWLPGPP
jgi:uncharacterized cupin superfamily protein